MPKRERLDIMDHPDEGDDVRDGPEVPEEQGDPGADAAPEERAGGDTEAGDGDAGRAGDNQGEAVGDDVQPEQERRGDPAKAIQQLRLEIKQLKQARERELRDAEDRAYQRAESRLIHIQQAVQRHQREAEEARRREEFLRNPPEDPALRAEWNEVRYQMDREAVVAELQAQRAMQEEQRIMMEARAMDEAADRELPGYRDSIDYIVQHVWVPELSMRVPPSELKAAVAARMKDFVMAAKANGVVPSVALYEMAKRLRWEPPAAAAPRQPAPQQVAQAKRSPAATSIQAPARRPSAPAGERMSMQDLLRADEDIFEALGPDGVMRSLSDRDFVSIINQR